MGIQKAAKPQSSLITVDATHFGWNGTKRFTLYSPRDITISTSCIRLQAPSTKRKLAYSQDFKESTEYRMHEAKGH
jgi:hypothetical protein